MIGRLLWKECREQLGKFLILFFAGLCCIGVGYLLNRHLVLSRFPSSTSQWEAACILILAFIAPIWMASGFTAAERRAGSFDVLLALPVPPSLIFAIKAFVGLLAYMLPVVFAFILERLIDGMPLGDLSFFISPLLTSAAIYFLMLTGTASTRSESRAAMIGVLILLTCLIWAFIVELAAIPAIPPIYWLFPNPFMLIECNPVPGAGPTHEIPEILILCFWAAAALWRFLRIASNTGTGSEEQQIPLTRTLLAPLPHPPLLWKEIREQFSVLVIAFWSAAGVAIIGALVDIEESVRHNETASFLDIYGVMLQVMLVAGAVAPLLISIVLGVGAFAGDLDERLLQFWRGQPIPTHHWFWTKYLVSAVGILLLIVVPLTIAAGGGSFLDFAEPGYATDPATRLRQQAWLAFIAIIVIVPFAHALSIFLAALIRRSMYASIAAIILLLALTTLPLFGGLNVIQILTNSEQPWQIVIVFLCGSVFLAMLLLLSARTLLARNHHLA